MQSNGSRPMTAYHPDILVEGLDVVFCGINPAVTAVTDGHNFSSPSNRFWPVLHLAGFTDTQIRPEEETRLLRFGCGITAAVTRATSRSSQVSVHEFRQARGAFEAKIRRWRPRVTAFLGKRALAAMIGAADLPWGRQPDSFADTVAWVLPNPSGLNRGFTLDALVCPYAELRRAIADPSLPRPCDARRPADQRRLQRTGTSPPVGIDRNRLSGAARRTEFEHGTS
jgi:TDG/mug DNA glycosylase family protein